MSARRPKHRRVATGALASAALVAVTAAGGVSGAEPPTPGTLDRPIADLAIIDGDRPTTLPRLLTLDTVDQPPGTVHVALLDRTPTSGWQATRAETVFLLDSADAPETPWLVELDRNRFVIVSSSHDRAQTTVVPIRVDPDEAGSLEVGPPAHLAMAVDDAGAIDVDADGGIELVVSSAVTLRGGATCQGSIIRAFDGTTLVEKADWTVPNVRLAGGVLGEWDGSPGGDLLAYAYGNCPAGPDSAQRLSIVAIRLADRSPITTITPKKAGASLPLPGVPLVADFDGDGRDEAVVRDGAELVILDPAHGWSRTRIASGDVTPIMASDPEPEASGSGGALGWLDGGGLEGSAIVLSRVARADDGAFAVTEQRMDLADVAPARRSRALESVRDVTAAQLAPPAWIGDIEGGGCTDVLAPLLTAHCVGDAHSTLAVGALWFATRPVAAFNVGGSRELLVAATMEWDPTRGRPLPATPAAVGSPGAWRHGPSVRFALSEVRAGDAAYFGLFPVPRPTIERAPVSGKATDFPGFTGSRIFMRVIGTGPNDPTPSPAPPLDEFLGSPPESRELIAVERVPVPPGAESGRDGSFVHVSLADVKAPNGEAAERWVVTIAQVNDWGEVAGPIRGPIVQDLSGPSLTVEPPFLSVPWPMTATIHGRSEPGVEVRGATGGPVKADRRGRFELRTELAPWPQTLELTAVDETGNVTVGRYSLVGGVDYRAFPWGAILAVTLLVGAVVSTGRGSRIRIAEPEVYADIDPQPEIEELTGGDRPAPASHWPRARS